jgi:uncharacterized protein
MQELLKDKKINIVVFILLAIVSLFFVVKFINEIKASKYIGYDSQYQNVIYVSGKGEVKAIPDIASLNINLSKEGITAKEAQKLLNESITKTLDYLKLQKIEDNDIKSEYGGLNPKYSYEKEICYTYPCPYKEPKIVGYTATQSITIKVRDVDKANEIRTSLAGLGITDISGPTFSIDDEDFYKNVARAKAISDAKIKAQTLAKDLGVKLGKIVNFSENDENLYPTVSRAEMMSDAVGMKATPAPELPKGENTITSNVTITYEIR